MTVRELIQELLAVKNQNKEVTIREIVRTEESYYSNSRPISDVDEWSDKVVIK